MTRKILSAISPTHVARLLCIMLLTGLTGCDDHKVIDQEKAAAPHNVKPAEQTVHNTKTTKVRGIDVSNYQGDVQWDKISAAGIGFAYMQATQGLHFVDIE